MITIKSEEEIKIMAQGGRILAEIMKELQKMVEPGITTKEINMAAESHIFKCGVKPAFKGYDGFPAALCASVNQVIVHGAPNAYELKNGDIFSLDLGIKYKGYYADMAVTVPVGGVEPEILRLIQVTRKALKRGIKKMRPGVTIGDIGNTIQRHIESQGFGIVRDLCGHGIGKKLHEDPQIPNYGQRHKGEKVKEGMVFCLEPMVTVGSWQIKKSKDGFGWETRDGSLSAHFEHMIAVTKDGSKVLTKI
ncbi:type I methionyl aminopeptidase [Candidatus Parcubacteria bacterium]|nr:type I methionyl aminopeptidase [Candidatus Parcubacteria bacterium]